MTPSEAAAIARQPLYFAALMVAAGDADGFVGGAANSTTDTVRALLQCIGMEPRITTLSSIFFLCVCDRSFGANGVLGFSDAAIVVDPSAIELADMAIASAGSTRKLVGVEPHVALISFSTKGSAKHKLVDKVVEAYRIVRERAPELNVDGELQVDAAIVPDVGAFKARGSTVAGRANTLVFPDLNTAECGGEAASSAWEAQPPLVPFSRDSRNPPTTCRVERLAKRYTRCRPSRLSRPNPRREHAPDPARILRPLRPEPRRTRLPLPQIPSHPQPPHG